MQAVTSQTVDFPSDSLLKARNGIIKNYEWQVLRQQSEEV